MRKSQPEKVVLPSGQQTNLTLSSQAAGIFLGVVQKSIAMYADSLSVRPDLDAPRRVELFDQFVANLVLEAKNFPLDGSTEEQEVQARATVCRLI